jgi:hypothetical protein
VNTFIIVWIVEEVLLGRCLCWDGGGGGGGDGGDCGDIGGVYCHLWITFFL